MGTSTKFILSEVERFGIKFARVRKLLWKAIVVGSKATRIVYLCFPFFRGKKCSLIKKMGELGPDALRQIADRSGRSSFTVSARGGHLTHYGADWF